MLELAYLVVMTDVHISPPITRHINVFSQTTDKKMLTKLNGGWRSSEGKL